MKDFFRQCLDELEDVAGIHQLHWLRQACEDQGQFDKRKETLINSMLIVSERFSFIPLVEQKKIVRRMMTEDTEYENLNSRTLTKWFNLFKNSFPFVTEEELTQHPPAPPEVAAKYLQEINANLAKIGNPLPTVAEIEQGLKEVKTKETGRQKFVIVEPCKVCNGTGLYSADPCMNCNGSGQINPVEIWATSEEEAKKAYDATFKP